MKIRDGKERTGNQTGGSLARSRTRGAGGLKTLLASLILLLAACGQLPPLPAQVEMESYAPITYEELLSPKAAKLQAGQKIKVPAYYWQFLTYDPAIVRSYLDMARYPLSWPRLQWFATYGTSNLGGYFELAALDPSQKKAFKMHRLDHIMIYGELASLGPGLYLRVHHVAKIEED
ncbi:MAG: hypothetical protein ACYDIC_04460 [Desulfobaccales bacterium]